MKSGEVAEWFSAVGTIAAVFWGVWQVDQDRRRKRREQQEAVHEIATVSERVARRWDQMVAEIRKARNRPSTQFLRSQRHIFDELQETLDRLLQRHDLTDGTVRCGVGARQLACRIVDEIDRAQVGGTSTFPAEINALKERAQKALEKSRGLRRAHGIRASRKSHTYELLIPPGPNAASGEQE